MLNGIAEELGIEIYPPKQQLKKEYQTELVEANSTGLLLFFEVLE